MPRSAIRASVGGRSAERSYSSDEMEEAERPPSNPGASVREPADRDGPGRRCRWSVLVLSALASVGAVAAAGCVCALLYPILKELRVERVIAHDGTEERILGFWSILVLSVLAGLVCFASSWTLTHLDSYKPGAAFTPLTHTQSRNVSDHGLYLGYGVAILNGIMGFLAVTWNLT